MTRDRSRRQQPVTAASDPLPVGEFPVPKRALLPEAIADSVAEAIATRHLQPGERIVETALADKYSVSRVPVREALKILATQGILTGGGHRGYRAASFSAEKVAQVFEVRLQLEKILLRDAITNWRAGKHDPSQLDEAIAQMRAAAQANDLRAMLRADLEFHRTISRAADNEIVGALWDAIARHVLIIFNLARHQDVDLVVPVRQHSKLRTLIREMIQGRRQDVDIEAILQRHFQPSRSPHYPGALYTAQRPRSARQSRNSAKVASSGG